MVFDSPMLMVVAAHRNGFRHAVFAFGLLVMGCGRIGYDALAQPSDAGAGLSQDAVGALDFPAAVSMDTRLGLDSSQVDQALGPTRTPAAGFGMDGPRPVCLLT